MTETPVSLTGRAPGAPSACISDAKETDEPNIPATPRRIKSRLTSPSQKGVVMGGSWGGSPVGIRLSLSYKRTLIRQSAYRELGLFSEALLMPALWSDFSISAPPQPLSAAALPQDLGDASRAQV